MVEARVRTGGCRNVGVGAVSVGNGQGEELGGSSPVRVIDWWVHDDEAGRRLASNRKITRLVGITSTSSFGLQFVVASIINTYSVHVNSYG